MPKRQASYDDRSMLGAPQSMAQEPMPQANASNSDGSGGDSTPQSSYQQQASPTDANPAPVAPSDEVGLVVQVPAPSPPSLDIAALQAKAEALERQARAAGEEAKREAEQQCVQLYDNKGNRVTHACEHCRQRKAKCSGVQPCDRCTRQGKLCEFNICEKKRKVSVNLRTPNELFASGMFTGVDAIGTAFRSPFDMDLALARGFVPRYAPSMTTSSPMSAPSPLVMQHSGFMLADRLYPASGGAIGGGGFSGSLSLPVSPIPTMGQYIPHVGTGVPYSEGGGRSGHTLSDWRTQSSPSYVPRPNTLPDYAAEIDERGMMSQSSSSIGSIGSTGSNNGISNSQSQGQSLPMAPPQPSFDYGPRITIQGDDGCSLSLDEAVDSAAISSHSSFFRPGSNANRFSFNSEDAWQSQRMQTSPIASSPLSPTPTPYPLFTPQHL